MQLLMVHSVYHKELCSSTLLQDYATWTALSCDVAQVFYLYLTNHSLAGKRQRTCNNSKLKYESEAGNKRRDTMQPVPSAAKTCNWCDLQENSTSGGKRRKTCNWWEAREKVTAKNPVNTRRTMGTRMTGNKELSQRSSSSPLQCCNLKKKWSQWLTSFWLYILT